MDPQANLCAYSCLFLSPVTPTLKASLLPSLILSPAPSPAPPRPLAMASLNNLLNPESAYESSARCASRSSSALVSLSVSLSYAPLPPRPSPRLQAARAPTSTAMTPTEKTIEAGGFMGVALRAPPRAEVVVRAHEPHPDCPDTLACLPDTDGRPQHTLPVILRCTILGSPRKRLTIREIYAAMERKYPYYKTAGPAWKVCTLFDP